MLVIHRILCPVDFSEPSERALEYALGLAERHGAEVDVVHVFQFPTFAVEDGTLDSAPFSAREPGAAAARTARTVRPRKGRRGVQDHRPRRYCQELWIGEAWLGGFLPIFFVFTAFDLNTINERNTSTHQG